MNEKELSFKVDGKTYLYTAHVEDEGSNTKIYHTVRGPSGDHSMDWSPYTFPTEEDLSMWVRLGMPDRTAVNTNGPINREHLQKLAGGLNESDLTFLKKWAGLL